MWGPISRVSELAGLGEDSRTCISNMFPGGPNCKCEAHTLKTAVLEFPEMGRACAFPFHEDTVGSWIYRKSFNALELMSHGWIRRVACLGFEGLGGFPLFHNPPGATEVAWEQRGSTGPPGVEFWQKGEDKQKRVWGIWGAHSEN